MALGKFLLLFLFVSTSMAAVNLAMAPTPSTSTNLFREYIGAEFKGVKLSDVPINPNSDFHFILSFANDYAASDKTPTNGDFNVFWDTDNLTPTDVAAVKKKYKNIKVALSIGGDDAYFNASSVDSWVANAITSLTSVINKYNLDGIDIYYKNFVSDPRTFAECIGRLVTRLKSNSVVSFASIAPIHYHEVQLQYLTLWQKYKDVIDYVNFQFYSYSPRITVAKFISNFEEQRMNYDGGKLLVSFSSNATIGGLAPDHGFFSACNTLRQEGKLYGIFIWSADDSLSNGFRYEKQAQAFLANSSSLSYTPKPRN